MYKKIGAAACCLLMIGALAGCGLLFPQEESSAPSESPSLSQEETQEDLGQTVDDAVAALKAADGEKVNQLVRFTDSQITLAGHTIQVEDNRLFPQDGQLDESTLALIQAVTASLECEVTSLQQEGDTAQVTAQLTTLNLGSIAKDLLMQAITGQVNLEEMTQPAQLADYLSNAQGETIQREVSFAMEKEGDQWVLLLDGQTVDAMLGGMASSLNQLLG